MTPPTLTGILILDKPAGRRSTDALNDLKRLFPRKTRIGHAGTLDAFATGVLVVLIGKATRLCEKLMDHDKWYTATIKFGAHTDSDDPDSPEEPVAGATLPTIEQVQRILPQFIGIIEQTPPRFSALKVGGMRASDRVRAGEKVVLASRPVRIDAIVVDAFEPPFLTITVHCGRGVYIRSLARDMGDALGCGGYLTALRRTRVGIYDHTQAIPFQTLKDAGDARGFLLPADLGENDARG